MEKNLSALSDLSGRWIDRVQARRSPGSIVLDLASSASPSHGEQEKSVWSGHFECTCQHPLLVFNQFADLERAPRARAKFTAPTAGGACRSLSLSVTGNGTCAATSGARCASSQRHQSTRAATGRYFGFGGPVTPLAMFQSCPDCQLMQISK